MSNHRLMDANRQRRKSADLIESLQKERDALKREQESRGEQMEKARRTIMDSVGKLDRLKADNEKLREALKVFVDLSDMLAACSDYANLTVTTNVSAYGIYVETCQSGASHSYNKACNAFRKARRALSQTEGE